MGKKLMSTIVFISLTAIDVNRFYPARKAFTFKRRPTAFCQQTLTRYDSIRTGIDHNKIGIMALSYVSSSIYAEKVGWTVGHHFHHLFHTPMSLSGKFKHHKQ